MRTATQGTAACGGTRRTTACFPARSRPPPATGFTMRCATASRPPTSRWVLPSRDGVVMWWPLLLPLPLPSQLPVDAS